MARKKDLRNHSGKKSGVRNTTSKNICVVLERLEKLKFVNRVSPGTFKNNSSDPKIDIIGYDHQKRKYMINVYGGKYVQKVTLDVPLQSSDYEVKIKSCAS